MVVRGGDEVQDMKSDDKSDGVVARFRAEMADMVRAAGCKAVGL